MEQLTKRGRQRRRATLIAAGAVAAALGLGPATGLAEDWPSRTINIVVPTDTGGSLDRMARLLAPRFAEALGQTVTVVNMPGGNALLAHEHVLNQEPDGHTLMLSPAAPHLVSHVIRGSASFEMEDFAFLNAQWVDWGAIVVPDDRPYQSIEELFAGIRENPGRLIAITVPNTERHVIFERLLELNDLSVDDVRLVTYQGGGAELMAALVNGQTDVGTMTVESIENMLDRVRVLMVIRPERHPAHPDVPTLAEVLGADADQLPALSGTIRTLAVPAAFRDRYPDRWERLVAVYEEMMADPAVRQSFLDQRVGADWVGPEVTTEMLSSYQTTMAPYLAD